MTLSHVPRVLFLHSGTSSFIEQDAKILSEAFDVDTMEWRSATDAATLWAKMRKSDTVISWWAAGHTMVAATMACILGIPCIAIAGGGEFARLKGLNYGDSRTAIGRWKVRLALKGSTKVLAVSEFTRSEVLGAVPSARVEVLSNAVDTKFFTPDPQRSPLVGVVTVGSVHPMRVRLKGIEKFARLSREIPDVPFYVVGPIQDANEAQRLLRTGGPNLQLTGPMDRVGLRDVFRRCAVYCQFSLRESFGLAVAEAMACGLVPVVSRIPALLETVGPTGRYVDDDSLGALATQVRQALSEAPSSQARNRVKSHFSLQRRREGLVQAVNEVLIEHRATGRPPKRPATNPPGHPPSI